jgi:hypothetical protein
MNREFIILPEFDRKWSEIGFCDKELAELEYQLCLNPQLGNMMRGTGGLRKMRFAFEGRGKSGSTRVVYVDVDFAFSKKVYLISAFTKAEKANLSDAEKNIVKAMIEQLKRDSRKG